MKSHATIALFAALAMTGLAHADSLDERFERANRALDARRFEDSARELRRIVALGVEDPDVYRNLGIAEAESMRYGHAMVAFERALSLRPRDEVARQGLENATTMLARRASERAGTPVEIAEPGALESFGRSMPEPFEAYGTLVTAWGFAIAAIAAMFARRETVRIASASLAAASLLVASVLGSALVGRARFGGTLAPAIVVVDSARARAAPDDRAPTITTLHEGDRVQLVERHGGFVQVAVGGNSRGWMNRTELGTY